MANFSGFLTNFISTNGGSGDFTDILSNLKTGTTDTISSNINIKWKYFYLGNLLIQFTNDITDNLSGSNYTLQYGLKYTNNNIPYFISLTATDNNGGTGSVTLNSLTDKDFTFSTSGGVSLTALVIGPK